ncbi:MAG: pyridoxal-phosphate dependent enzyme [Terrimicrobiaceae bacterium]
MSQDHAILHRIGRTPLSEITRLDTGLCRLFVKHEEQNPSGSIKDRVALSMIIAAEQSGALRPGGTIIEATAGNTGLGLALVGAARGYGVILVIPDKMSQEKVRHIHALGARVHITRSDVNKGHPEYYQDFAARLAREISGAHYINQFENPANPLAHERTTGPEIWDQMAHDVDAIVCGVGSGGTITGLSRFFSRVQPHAEIILADPAGSILAEYTRSGRIGEAGSWAVEGIGEDFIPVIADLSRVRKAYSITDTESFETARDLLREEGILGGSSSGTLVAAALHYCREQTRPKRVVTLICDSGNKYLSKMFNDFWMVDQGYIERSRTGDLRDLISRRHDRGEVVSVGPGDSLLTAYQRMRVSDVSQLPVLEEGRIIGILDESDLLVNLHGAPERFHEPVRSAMIDGLEKVTSDTPFSGLLEIFDRGHVAIVVEHDCFLGLVTRSDLLSHLRRTMP